MKQIVLTLYDLTTSTASTLALCVCVSPFRINWCNWEDRRCRIANYIRLWEWFTLLSLWFKTDFSVAMLFMIFVLPKRLRFFVLDRFLNHEPFFTHVEGRSDESVPACIHLLFKRAATSDTLYLKITARKQLSYRKTTRAVTRHINKANSWTEGWVTAVKVKGTSLQLFSLVLIFHSGRDSFLCYCFFCIHHCIRFSVSLTLGEVILT